MKRDVPLPPVGGVPTDPGGPPTGQPYLLSYERWPAGQTTITWSFNDLILAADGNREQTLGLSLSDDLRGIVREAMDAWERVCGVEFAEVGDSASADVRIGWQPDFARNPEYESDGPGGTLGVTWTWFFGNVIDRQSVVFDHAESWTSDAFYDTALHELGHVLGIDHSDVRGAVMSGLPITPYADVNPSGRDGLTADDVAAARALWGPPAGQGRPTDGGDQLYGTEGPEEIDGLGGHDRIFGYGGADTLLGGDGNDRLLGGTGNDVVAGERGDDRIWGERGDDVLHGGPGDDLVFGMEGDDEINGGYGRDVVLGGSGDDFILGDDGVGDDDASGSASGDGGDGIWGEGGDDTIWGEGGDDFLAGGSGHDSLYGEGGEDYLAGGSGNDRLLGGSGYDVLAGGSGDDTLVGGVEGDTFFGQAGADRYEYHGGTLWLMDLEEHDSVFFANGARVVDLDQLGWHARVDMSDGGTIFAAWTHVEDLDLV